MRQILIILGILFGLAGPAFVPADALSDEAAERLGERVLGDPGAPVTIYEHSSLTCPHCATFHRDTLPMIKKDYIDTGKAKLVFRDFPFDRLGLLAAMTGRCLEREKYFGYLEILFKTQRKWATAKDPVAALRAYTRLAGMSDTQFESCIRDETLMNTILQRRQEAQRQHGIDSTPSFVINGKKVAGAQPFAEFQKVIESALAK